MVVDRDDCLIPMLPTTIFVEAWFHFSFAKTLVATPNSLDSETSNFNALTPTHLCHDPVCLILN
jgi:hypothetical protein